MSAQKRILVVDDVKFDVRGKVYTVRAYIDKWDQGDLEITLGNQIFMRR